MGHPWRQVAGWGGGACDGSAVTAVRAGRDLGVFLLQRPQGSSTLSRAGPSRLEILCQKTVRKGESAAPGPQHHLPCLHPEGKPFSRRKGAQGLDVPRREAGVL